MELESGRGDEWIHPIGFWADYPGLGFDSGEAVYLTSNQYDRSSPNNIFQYAKLRILYKSQLYWSGSGGSLGWWDFWNSLDADGVNVFTWKPAQAQSALSGNYLIDTRWNGASFVTLWRLTNPLASGPTLTRQATVSLGSYSPPANAAQQGGSETIDVGDCRTQEVKYQNGELVTAFTESYNWGSGSVSAIRTLRLNATSGSVNLDWRFGADGLWYYYPAVVRDPAGNLAMVFTRSGSSEYAGARYTAWLTTDTQWQSSSSLKAGEAYYVNKDTVGRNRWGDYAGVAIDPADTTRAWVYSEYALSGNQWGTWIGEIPLQSSSPPEIRVQVGLNNIADGQNRHDCRHDLHGR